MKQVTKNSITDIPNTNPLEKKMSFNTLSPDFSMDSDIEIFFMHELLEKRKNIEILEQVQQKPAMYSNVYSPKDELEIFTQLFEMALRENKKIHIFGVTLGAEIKILEEYYETLWFIRADINAFDVDFSKVLVSVSVNIENLMWKGSDYKAQRDKIFFCPPIRESWEVKAMFKWINRGVTAGICFGDIISNQACDFLQSCLQREHILSMMLSKVLFENLTQTGLVWSTKQLIIEY